MSHVLLAQSVFGRLGFGFIDNKINLRLSRIVLVGNGIIGFGKFH